MGEPDGPADLYGIDLTEFTTARDALAKRLRAGGDKAEADRVKKLRRPSLTAWALNQAARRHQEVLDAALDAGAGLRGATLQAISGDVSALRQAQVDERRAVDQAVSAAAGILGAAGHPPTEAAKMRMAGTIRAAFLDDELSDQLRLGVLEGDHEAAGFGFDGSSAPAPRSPQGSQPVPADKPAADEVARQRAKRRAAELTAAAGDLDRRAKQLREASDHARQEAAVARRAAEEAERQAGDADRHAGEVEHQAAAARDRAAAAVRQTEA